MVEMVGINIQRNDDGHHFCECGYTTSSKNRRDHLMKHQQMFCSLRKPSVQSDLPCEICGKLYTYEGLKSHIRQFINPNRKNQATNHHASVGTEEHIRILENAKEKEFGTDQRKRKSGTNKKTNDGITHSG